MHPKAPRGRHGVEPSTCYGHAYPRRRCSGRACPARGELTTGQLHRVLSRYSQEGIRKVLIRLTRQGVVYAERVGNSYSYRLNGDHLAARPIIELAHIPRTLLQRLEDRLSAWAFKPTYAAVFGSAARGTMTEDSDLDILLVLDDDTPIDEWERRRRAGSRRQQMDRERHASTRVHGQRAERST